MQSNKKDRQPAVAGSFYPSDAAELKKMISGFMAAAKPDQTTGLVRAIVVPHAGYVFSGGVAASGYNQLNPDHVYKRIFILASSHRFSFGKASVFTQGDYITPLGRVTVDCDVANELIKSSKAFTDYPEAHISEHSIEVQLPFLQTRLKYPIKIVPIILGTQVPAVCEDIADGLKPWFTSENLFVISADFSHYPAYEEAIKVDSITAKAFCTNSPDEFLKAIRNNEELRIPELATSMCAWPSGLTLLYLTQGNNKFIFNKIDYKNSGDIKPYGDKASVVGYNAICISEPQEKGFRLTEADEHDLISIARNTVDTYVRTRSIPPLNPTSYSENLKVKAGAFVTLKIDGDLRGCIGSFEPNIPLYKVIQEMAIASSTQDSRFQPVQEKELEKIRIEISVLTPMRKIKNISEIQLGKHGIYIKKGFAGGTFLPQVATETGWTLDEFLGHCARDKAGIGWTGWKDADIYTYEALIFEEDIPKKK
ncbi:MAG: AmmeMemoRadiSam system protein B [Bacteroidia bacterium]|nr:AmmeMemoRadiSam system protein B [Bacteroidia bacterium]